MADAVIDYAVKHNITKIVVGKPSKPRWREFLLPPTVDQIIRLSGAIDVLCGKHRPGRSKNRSPPSPRPKRADSLSGYMASLALVAAATLPVMLVRPFLAPTNMVMIYLLAVVMAALRLGLKPAILTAFLGVLCL